MRYVHKSDGCWLWMGSKTKSGGYGQFSFGGFPRRAHRLSYEFFVGPIPEGLDVCHHCDTPACIRPDHLFVGTHLDNMKDMVAKGRNSRVGSRGRNKGEGNGKSCKLNNEKVRAIRKIIGTKALRKIATDFGVGFSTIRDIARGAAWEGV